MRTRYDLHEFLTNLPGCRAVYFQPPESIKMEYPCIVYSRDSVNHRFASNSGYSFATRYQITFIGYDPDLDLETFKAMTDLPMCTYDRHYVYDTLHHDVFDLYLPLVFEGDFY